MDDRIVVGIAPFITAAEPLLLPPVDWNDWDSVKPELIACVPSTGYFAAGGLAGLISRTSTAPLDRLKVYLIAHVEAKNPGQLVRIGNLHTFAKSLISATKDLWAAGGMRSLYAGMFLNFHFLCGLT
jgi:solute carrier family 25 phosphate transporter 23/24/25/41